MTFAQEAVMSVIIDPKNNSDFEIATATAAEEPVTAHEKVQARNNLWVGVFGSLMMIVLVAWCALLAYGAWWLLN
jgi:hypothetical protein